MKNKDIILSLSPAQANHLQLLLARNEEEGTCNRPISLYWDRHNRIKAKLIAARPVETKEGER
ncbi:hypothetical protein CCP3SC15_2750001 [Gammaproteobacteria bacterium]